jgi:hypothetical protein
MNYLGFCFKENFQFCALYKFFGVDNEGWRQRLYSEGVTEGAAATGGHALASLDADGSGNLDTTELPAHIIRVVESLDDDTSNDNGNLDAEELAKAVGHDVFSRAWEAASSSDSDPAQAAAV